MKCQVLQNRYLAFLILCVFDPYFVKKMTMKPKILRIVNQLGGKYYPLPIIGYDLKTAHDNDNKVSVSDQFDIIS